MGDDGDLIAFSAFKKTIENPIEAIVLRDPINFEAGSSALFRTFFNNPDDAELLGFEFEARKNLGFIEDTFMQYFSLGGNFTYIDAEVDRTDPVIARSEAFFAVRPGEEDLVNFNGLRGSRALFGQPEWIVNADVNFTHPDWGTSVTLAYYAISDILDAAGSVTVQPDGTLIDYTLDRYSASFHQLDLIFTQEWKDWTFKVSVKNLTDSSRGVIYDSDQTNGEINEREYKVGRDYSFSISRTF